MANSFLRKLFGREKRSTVLRDLDLTGAMKRLAQPGTPSSDSASQKDSKPHKSPAAQKADASKVRLFAFVDPKDPFAAGELAGEELPGPILSTMNARDFDSVFLFCTLHTRENAWATERELSRRYPRCRVSVLLLPISDPRNYLSLMRELAPVVRKLLGHPHPGPPVRNYVCVSSGTAEMRVTWFLLSALGVLPAKLLQAGTPPNFLQQQLVGEVNVREVRTDTGDWKTVREVAVRGGKLEALRLRLPGLEEALPRAGKEEPASSKSKFLKAFESQDETTEEAPPQEPPREETPAEAIDKTLFLGGRERPESRNATARESPAEESDEGIEEVVGGEGGTPVPGLDDALQELGIYVRSAVLRHAAERAGIAAGSDLPVLLLGETGTGKERFAHLIHRMSPRRYRELVAVNCAAIPESLAESYLFGHMKGAFSGATGD